MQIREIKRKPTGAEQTFTCDLLYRDDEAMVILYRSSGNFAGIATHSEGYYWQGRNYLIYKMFRGERLVGHRFDVCRDVRFGPDSVEFLDLYLDFFLTPDGQLQVHDEDEVEEAIEQGVLNTADQAIINHTRALVSTHYEQIIAEAAALRRRVPED